MIELYLEPRDKGGWDFKATILPKGGLGLAQEATLAQINQPDFRQAQDAIVELSSVSFSPNPDRWPKSDHVVQIINDGEHSNPKEFGNYSIVQKGRGISRLTNFPRGDILELIRATLAVLNR